MNWPTYVKDLRTRLGLTQRKFGNAIGAGVPTPLRSPPIPKSSRLSASKRRLRTSR